MNNRLKKALIIMSTIFSVTTILGTLPVANATTIADWWYGPTDDTKWKGVPNNKSCAEYCGTDSATTIDRCCLVRYKGDSSSVYVKNETPNKKAYVSVYSSHGTNEGKKKPDLQQCNGANIRTVGLSIPEGSARKIYQYIWENRSYNGSYVHIHFYTTGTYGKWSPACAGEWNYENAENNIIR